MAPTSPSDQHFSASIVLYRSDLELLRRTLLALLSAVDAADAPLTLWVVDQSLDTSYSTEARVLLDEIFSGGPIKANLEVLDTNHGYGAGHNWAFKHVLGEFHLILNPDVELAANTLSQALDIFRQNPELVLLAPIGFGEDGEREYLAKRYPSPLVLALRAFAPNWIKSLFSRPMAWYEYQDLSFKEPLHPVTLVSGCCMLVRSEALKQVCGFDEKFFLYFEDYDLSLRLAQLGMVAQSARISVVHHGGNAARKGLNHIIWFVRGMIRFLNRWGWRPKQ